MIVINAGNKSLLTSTSTSTSTLKPTIPPSTQLNAFLTPISVQNLFPHYQIQSKIKPKTHTQATDTREEEEKERDPLIYELNCPTFEKEILHAVNQFYLQSNRRAVRLPLDDADFAQTEKTRKSEQARRTFRSGTRYNFPVPERRKPLSSLLFPPASVNVEAQKPLSWILVEKNGQDVLNAENLQKKAKSLKSKYPFPGSVPCSLMASDIDRLYDPQFYWCIAPKTNGLRFLFIGLTFHQQQLLVLINRAQDIYIVRLPAPMAMFDGTILDGELVILNDGTFSLLIFDAILVCGVPCAEYNYLVRLQLAELLVHSLNLLKVQSLKRSDLTNPKSERKSTVAPFSIQVKKVYAPVHIMHLLTKVIPSLDHEIDGLIFTAVEPAVPMGKTRFIHKYKNGCDNTIDLLFKPTTLSSSSTNSNSNSSNQQQQLGEGKLLCISSKHKNRYHIFTTVQLFGAHYTNQSPTGQREFLLGLISQLFGKTIFESQSCSNEQLQQKILDRLTNKVVEWRFVVYNKNNKNIDQNNNHNSNNDKNNITDTHNKKLLKMADGYWYPETIRYDKLNPNLDLTAFATWQNIVENLRVPDLFPEGSIPNDVRQQLFQWDASFGHLSWHDIQQSANKHEKQNQNQNKNENKQDYSFVLSPLPLAQLTKF
jgi:hypothetical protein